MWNIPDVWSTVLPLQLPLLQMHRQIPWTFIITIFAHILKSTNPLNHWVKRTHIYIAPNVTSETKVLSSRVKGKGKCFPIPSAGPGPDPSVQAVSPQVTVSHPPGGRLPLLSARPAVTSPAAEHHRPLAGTKLYCLVTEAHRCEQLAQGCYAALPRVGFEPATYWSQVQRYTRCTTAPPE